MRRSESVEMYLETIFTLSSKNSDVRMVDVATSLGVTKPSVNKMMNILKEEKLVNQEHYGTISLTEKGRLLAKDVYERHLLIKEFLVQALTLDDEVAEKDACKMEHIISVDMIEAIKNYMNK